MLSQPSNYMQDGTTDDTTTTVFKSKANTDQDRWSAYDCIIPPSPRLSGVLPEDGARRHRGTGPSESSESIGCLERLFTVSVTGYCE